MSLSHKDLECILNGDRDYFINIETEKMCSSIIDELFLVYSKYMLWSYKEFESAVDYIENCYENRQTYLNTTHQGIFERMKTHTSKRGESFGEKLVSSVLREENYTFKQECYIGHSVQDAQSIRLDFVVFYKNVLYVIEYNGEQHYRPVEHFGGEKQFEIQKQNDAKKKAFCEMYKIPLLEIPYTIRTKEEVKDVIKNFLY